MPRPGLGALREREFRLLFLATATTRLGSAMAPIALAFGVLELTGSVTDLGFVLAAGSLPFVVAVVGPGWTMLFNAATSLAEVAIRFLMRVDEVLPTPERRRPFRHGFTDGWRAVTSRRWLLVMLAG